MQKKAMIHVGKRTDRAIQITRQHEGTVLAEYSQAILIRVADSGLQALEEEGFRVREIVEQPVVRMAGFELDTTRPSGRSTRALAAEIELPSGLSHHIVRLIGPMHPDWQALMTRMGVLFYQSLADDHYLVGVASDQVEAIGDLEFVEAISPYYPALKVNAALLTRDLSASLATADSLHAAPAPASAAEPDHKNLLAISVGRGAPADPEDKGNLELRLFDARDQLDAVDAVRQVGGRVITAAGEVVVVYADLSRVPALAAIPQVREVNPYKPRTLANNVATGITRIDTLRNDHGLDGSGQIVGIADSGLDTGVDDASMLADFQGRIVSIHALGRPGDASDIHNHGTHVAGSVLGDGANSNNLIQGMAPAARVVFQSTMDASRELGGLPTDLRMGLFDVARDDGARIHTNSWSSSPTNGAYLTEASQADDFAFNNREFLILFAAGNDAPSRVNSPGSAKNVLTIGASESTRPLTGSVTFPSSPTFPSGAVWSDFDDQADDQNDVAGFSCPGPVQNNRRKPDVVAPGTFILSTRSSVSTDDRGPDGIPDTGDEDGVFTHPEAVGLGLPGEPVFGTGSADTPAAPAGAGPDATNNYYYSNGTSMSTPITAGACALLRQYLIEQRGHTPSAALLKAIIINGAVDMGMGVPDDGQGWGRIDLTNTLFPPGTGRIQFDDTLDNAVATTEIRTYDVFVSSTGEPLAVTLVWRDPAGSTIQNRLHLRVIHVATGTTATADDIADIRNNVQKVVIDPPVVGLYRIEVEGVAVTTGVPELTGLRQDYSLVVANAMGFSCNPSDILQVIDRSGSMGYSGYMEPAKARAKQMIDILQINDQAGVVTFASSAAAGDPMPLTLIDSQEDKDDAHDLIDPITAGGMTDLREALEQGLATLGADAGRPRAMIFLSDGKHTVPTPEIDDPFLDSIAGANVSVYTIALGPASDLGVLNNIAARTGTGASYTVNSAADLHKLHEIYYDIIGGIGCGGLVHLSSDPVNPERHLTHTVAIDQVTREALFAFSWSTENAEFECSIADPDGTVHNSGTAALLHYTGKTHAYYRVNQPKPGIWRLRVRSMSPNNPQSTTVTTAVMADSDVHCQASVDPKYLYHGIVMLSLKASYRDRPVLKGNATAQITFPTVSIDKLLDRYHAQLKEIRIKPEALKGDEADLNLIKLDLLAQRLKNQGKDIFEQKTFSLRLTDDGKQQDPKADDGIYTAFFNPGEAKVAGSFMVRVWFEAADDSFGTRTCTRLLPVYVPQVATEIGIRDIFARKNMLWRYAIIGAVVEKGDGSPATPEDGTTVRMKVTQGRNQAVLKQVPYYRKGRYYIWRFRNPGFSPGKATVEVTAKMARKTAERKEIIKL